MALKSRTKNYKKLTVEVGALTAAAQDTQAAGSTLTLVNQLHGGKMVLLNTAAGSVVTLPAATGSGVEYTFVVTTLATSNSHKIQVANASDIMIGSIATIDTDTSDAYAAWATTSTSDTITLNRTTTGSVRLGETITAKDVATNRWLIDGLVCVTGTPATPFSAAVS